MRGSVGIFGYLPNIILSRFRIADLFPYCLGQFPDCVEELLYSRFLGTVVSGFPFMETEIMYICVMYSSQKDIEIQSIIP